MIPLPVPAGREVWFPRGIPHPPFDRSLEFGASHAPALGVLHFAVGVSYAPARGFQQFLEVFCCRPAVQVVRLPHHGARVHGLASVHHGADTFTNFCGRTCSPRYIGGGGSPPFVRAHLLVRPLLVAWRGDRRACRRRRRDLARVWRPCSPRAAAGDPSPLSLALVLLGAVSASSVESADRSTVACTAWRHPARRAWGGGLSRR